MTEGDKTIRWRLIGISSTDDETRFVAALCNADEQTRTYTFIREVVQTRAGDIVQWDASEWDLHSLYDRDSFKAVMDAIIATYNACQREIALGNDHDRKPPPGSSWRLIGIRATDDDSRYIAVVSDREGQTREYLFSRDPTTIGGHPAFIWHTGDWDIHTLFDRASFKAVLDAVIAFYEARQREMALGDDEERKPPGL